MKREEAETNGAKVGRAAMQLFADQSNIFECNAFSEPVADIAVMPTSSLDGSRDGEMRDEESYQSLPS